MKRSQPLTTECEHRAIRTFWISEGKQAGDVKMWACQDCSLRFYPACSICVTEGHRGPHPSSKKVGPEELRAYIAQRESGVGE